MGGYNLPPPIVIGLTDLLNIGWGHWPPGPTGPPVPASLDIGAWREAGAQSPSDLSKCVGKYI